MSIPQTISTLTRYYGFTLGEARELATTISKDGFKAPYIHKMLVSRKMERARAIKQGVTEKPEYQRRIRMDYLKKGLLKDENGNTIKYRKGMKFDAVGRLYNAKGKLVKVVSEGSKRIWRLVQKYEKDWGQSYESPWKKKRIAGQQKDHMATTRKSINGRIDKITKQLENPNLPDKERSNLLFERQQLIDKGLGR